MKVGTSIRSALVAATIIVAASVAACRVDIVKAQLAPPALEEFVAYRIGLSQLYVGSPSPVYPAGTALLYTLDGSDPRDGAAVLGAGMTIDAVPEPTLLRVVASLEGFVPSEVAAKVVSELVTTLSTPALDTLIYSSGNIYVPASFFSPYPPGTVVRYTINGPAPDESSFALSQGSMSAIAPFTMRARAYCAGYRPSELATATDGEM